MDEIRYISSFDNEFPERLRTIPDPPQGIYVKGKLPDPNRPSVSIIGARACSEYGKGAAEYFAKKLSENGVQIISGMARGIDGIAQRTAVDAGYESFGVLGNGIDVVYPRENSRLYETILNKGGLISEFPPGTQGLPAYFPKRNRIISGLCNVLLVIEARAKSGTLSTVCHALNQGREIFAVPGRISDPLSVGCNRLI
nr:DNA-processing protein DprA [Lachnospiraceae bacterium]